MIVLYKKIILDKLFYSVIISTWQANKQAYFEYSQQKKGFKMLNVKLEGFGYLSTIETIALVKGNNSLETVINFKLDSLSAENQQAILEVLNKHLNSLGTSELLELLAK